MGAEPKGGILPNGKIPPFLLLPAETDGHSLCVPHRAEPRAALQGLGPENRENTPPAEGPAKGGAPCQKGCFRVGTPEKIRTSDPPLRRRVLYPAELQAPIQLCPASAHPRNRAHAHSAHIVYQCSAADATFIRRRVSSGCGKPSCTPG